QRIRAAGHVRQSRDGHVSGRRAIRAQIHLGWRYRIKYAGRVLLVPVVALLSIFLLPFGVEAVLCAPLLDISAEMAPPGNWPVCQLDLRSEDDISPYIEPSVSDETQRRTPVTLMHSSYNDPRAMRAIHLWLQSRLLLASERGA